MKVFLIGMMGSGKSHWAKLLGNHLSMPCYDLDTVIETAEGCSISTLFETQGEPAFRLIEADALRSFATVSNAIIATGGGTPCFYNNIEWMNTNGKTIWLNLPTGILVSRLLTAKKERPLVANVEEAHLKEYIEGKLLERTPFYSKAQHQVDGLNIKKDDFLKLIQSECIEDI